MSLSTVLLSALLLGACTVGEVDIGGNPGTDSGPGGDGMNNVNPKDVCADRGTVGIAHVHALAGANPAGPRSGIGCMNVGGCHGAQPGSSVYAMSGTAYKQSAGTTVNPGAVIRVFKEGPVGKYTLVTSSVTDDAGNFRIVGTYNDYPYLTDVTACGSDAPVQGIRAMLGQINTGNGNCNGGAACHQVPGTLAIWLAD